MLPVVALTVEAAPATAAVNDQAVSGVASPIWQPNGVVDALAAANGVIYAGGNFTSVRPGAGMSGSQTSRTYLAAFNASTGALITSFNFTLNGRVWALDLSPDNNTLYVGGAFSSVNGTARGRVAAINLTNGTLNTSFNPNANRVVREIESTSSTVYIGGDFTTVRGSAQAYMASVTASTGALNTAFAPTFIQRPDSTCPDPPNPNFPCTVTTYTPNVLAIAMAPDGSRLLTGGNFMGVNGVSSGGMASLDPITGATEQWDANNAAPAGQPINTNCAGRVSDIVVQGTHAYVTGVGDPPGCYEGTYDATISDGSINWLASCLGASQGLTIMNNILYKGSHQHDCAFTEGGAMGGFVGGTGRSGFIHHFLVAQNLSDGSFVHWTPNTNSSGTAATGPHVMANDGTQIIVGGDFTTVNRTSQTYLTRFVANGNHATPTVPGRNVNSDPFGGNPATLAANLSITVQPTAANTLTVLVPTSEDNDSGTLTYRIYRDNGTNPIATMTAESYTWSRPTLRFDDKNLVAGSTHSYRVTASDGTFTSARSTAVSGTVATSAPPPFATAVSSLSPSVFWRLGDSGSTAADSSSSGANPGTFVGGVTRGVAGAMAGNGAIDLDGSSGYVTSNLLSTPGAFTESAWFKTTSTRGGLIMALSSNQTGSGGTTDRAISMDNNGDIAFSLAGRGGSLNFRNQDTIWNDGQWHQVVGTWDGNLTISLYVDGQLIGSTVNTTVPTTLQSGYMRVGYADMAGLQRVGVFGINFYQRTWPISQYFDGQVDEATTFNYALSPAQIQSMFAAGVGSASAAPANQPPTAAFSSTMSHLSGSFDSTGSGDVDGTIASYDWNFGDGSAHGSGPSPTHAYAAAGPYTVTLTVTDDDGATTSVSHGVTATEPASTTTSTVVPAGSTWSWKYDNNALPSNWNSRTFNASSWNSGAGVLGFGNNVGVVTNIDTFATTAERPLTAYFTRQFQVPDASSVVQLTLDTRADDGIVVYVNGTEVGRTNMPSGTVTTGTWASSAVSTANSQRPTYTVPTSLLVDGTNVISAETHLNYRATRNATFDLSATITTAQ
ncbi:LamG-like jellyroll fold domain-containing protein [Nocardioides mangrovi]|uniref:LamG-like jellyroll fold domain-containing protein n=1 Tax=Nocardioides mangrovi TaxID=2874580 RepID=UPI001CC4F23C|nr:LamG-like jellyroll fold domain-containing protein [Nocardioides mangrovi]